MNESQINLLRHQALETFKLEKSFLRDLENTTDNSELLINLLTNSTDSQIKCLIYILFFIFQKEIPVSKKILHKLSSYSIKNFQELLKERSEMDFFDSFSRQQYLSIVLGFRKAWPYLVKPILHKNG